MRRRTAGGLVPALAWGLLSDALLGDPRRGHPVAGFGRLAAAAERVAYRDSRAAGALYAGGLVGAAAVTGLAVGRLPRGRTLLGAAAVWTVLGGRSLRREAEAVRDLLDAGDLAGARARLPHLCGRDAGRLDEAGLARAVIESVAENTSDAVVGPLVWGALAGLPGLLGYRAANTLDAMVGHRSPRYLRFGWAAARLDDAANLLPARFTAGLAVLLGGHPGAAWRAWRRDAPGHPSPNAGPVEAAFAGSLGRTLGGPLAYAGRVEHRPRLGEGPAPATADITRAVTLSATVSLAAGGLVLAARALAERR